LTKRSLVGVFSEVGRRTPTTVPVRLLGSAEAFLEDFPLLFGIFAAPQLGAGEVFR
jgi:hypothetical protein